MTDYYSTIAAGYDELYGQEQDDKLRQLLLRHEPIIYSSLLDVGCGTGRSHTLLPQIKWQGIDPSPGLIAHSHEDIRKKIICCKGEKLPFPNSMFNYVLSLTALQNFDDPNTGLIEMNRVLKPDGILLLSFLKRGETAQSIIPMVAEHFIVIEHWEDSKDFFFVAKKK